MTEPRESYARLPHVLVVTVDEDDEARYYEIRCPYPTSPPPPCATQEPCGCDTPTDADGEVLDSAYDDAPCPRHPGQDHFHDGNWTGEMVAPIGSCWPREYDDLRDAVEASDLLGLPAGEHPVTFAAEDGGEWMSLALATGRDRSGASDA